MSHAIGGSCPNNGSVCFCQRRLLSPFLHSYEDDKYIRLMPGKRDCVSLGKKEYRQKRLLLCNLNELHAAYKEKHPTHKIGLSKFCSLRPKWCVTVSSSGTHSVCVCTIHQNTKLLVDAFSGNINGCMRRINRAAAGDADGEEVEEVQSYLQGLNEDYCV